MTLLTFLVNARQGDIVGGAVFCGRVDDRFVFLCACGDSFSRKYNNPFRTVDHLVCGQCAADRRRNDDWGFRTVHKRMRHDAGRRGIFFDLSLEYLKSVILMDCHYCGVAPMNEITYKSKVGRTEAFRYSGLDRMDSSGGYVEGNCVPCCPICNRAKGSVSYDEFTLWVERMSTRNAARA